MSLNMVNYCCKTFVDTTRQKNDFMIFNIKYAMKEKTLLFPVEITFLLIRDKNPSWCLVHCKKTESRNDSVLCHVVNRRRQLLVSTWVRR